LVCKDKKIGYLIVSGMVKKCIIIYSQSENPLQCYNWKYLYKKFEEGNI